MLNLTKILNYEMPFLHSASNEQQSRVLRPPGSRTASEQQVRANATERLGKGAASSECVAHPPQREGKGTAFFTANRTQRLWAEI